MKLTITGKKEKPFSGTEGESVPWTWYQAKKEDGFSIRFGSSVDYEINQSVEIDLEERSRQDGSKWYKEVASL